MRMKKVVYVDGLSGTTGLKIMERLNLYSEIEVIKIAHEHRRDPIKRAECLNDADLVFLCLPDDAAKESVGLVKNPKTKIIDASTAHRTNPNFQYGLAELSLYHREAIQKSHRISNPGCHASAFLLSVYPLVQSGILPKNYPLACQSITGYSGGGKPLIEKYENTEMGNPYKKAPRAYSLSLEHKHLKEMTLHSGLELSPVFVPVVGDFYQGLATTISLHKEHLNSQVSGKQIHDILSNHYKDQKFVHVKEYGDDSLLYDGGFDITGCNHSNHADIFVFGNQQGHTVVMTRLDNLGKGASGAAVQNMNLMLGFEESLHLL